jgi:hypothetical protein
MNVIVGLAGALHAQIESCVCLMDKGRITQMRNSRRGMMEAWAKKRRRHVSLFFRFLFLFFSLLFFFFL